MNTNIQQARRTRLALVAGSAALVVVGSAVPASAAVAAHATTS